MSFCEEIRRAVMASPRMKLPEIRSAMYKAFTAGQITEAEAEDPRYPDQCQSGHSGHRGARTGGASGPGHVPLPRWKDAAPGPPPAACRPALAAQFTLAEQAVLAVVASEVKKHGACTLTIGHIAALAGVSETTVRNALRQAQALALVTIEERRRTAWMNHPNKVCIVSKEWAAWLRLATGTNSRTPRVQNSKRRRKNRPSSIGLCASNRDPKHLGEPQKGYRHSRWSFTLDRRKIKIRGREAWQ